MKKIIWILNYKTNDLQSVENISTSLMKFYRSLKDDFELKEIILEDNRTDRQLLKRFKTSPPDFIAVIHPSVNFHLFFLSLLALAKNSSFLVHLFGNFLRNGELWEKQAHLFAGKNVKFFSPSESYQKVLLNFISEKNISVLPFPVQKSEAVSKREYGNEWKLMYAGRYHEQKNISQMISVLNELAEKKQKKIILTLMVCFDDFNPTTLQKKKVQGEQYHRYLETASELSPWLEINLVPHGSFVVMAKLLSSQDAFISFSTFLDEDYGCAVLEALSAGVPCVVTRWGGYGDFSNTFQEDCFGLKVESEDSKLYLNLSSLEEFLSRACSKSQNEREALAKKAVSFADHKRLEHLLKSAMKEMSKFDSFKKELGEFSRELKRGNNVDNFKKYYRSFWNFPGDHK